MHTPIRRLAGLIALGLFLLGPAVPPAAADTTIAEYLKLDKPHQADLLGSLLQSLAEDLQNNKREREALCLQALYTPNSEARATMPLGMQDFFQSVDIAREGDPKKMTVEVIIARQLVQYCGTRPK